MEKYNSQFHISNTIMTLKPGLSHRDYYEQVKPLIDSHNAKLEDNCFYTASKTKSKQSPATAGPVIAQVHATKRHKFPNTADKKKTKKQPYVAKPYIAFLPLEHSFCKNQNQERKEKYIIVKVYSQTKADTDPLA